MIKLRTRAVDDRGSQASELDTFVQTGASGERFSVLDILRLGTCQQLNKSSVRALPGQ
jgi:hypothetical protein